MFHWVEHTAELELELEARTEAEVFAVALAAFAELTGDSAGPPLEQEIQVEAADAAMRLVAWLEELIYLSEREGFVPERIDALELDGDSLHARVAGHAGQPAHLVKAVTLHRLELRENEAGGWRGRVVLDV
jgi:SHS2 domain-containing protein